MSKRANELFEHSYRVESASIFTNLFILIFYFLYNGSDASKGCYRLRNTRLHTYARAHTLSIWWSLCHSLNGRDTIRKNFVLELKKKILHSLKQLQKLIPLRCNITIAFLGVGPDWSIICTRPRSQKTALQIRADRAGRGQRGQDAPGTARTYAALPGASRSGRSTGAAPP